MQAAPGSEKFVDPLVGAVVAQRYRLVRMLGAGGMGRVYAAEPVAGGARIALKMLLGEFLSNKNVVERFLEEGRTVQRLAHPNVVRVMDTGNAEDGTPFIAMELLEGQTLGALTAISQVGDGPIVTRKLPPDQAIGIMHAILAALGAAHSIGVVHRDLKPDNIFLPTGAPPSGAKILDFGVAKVVDAAGGAGTRTRTGMLLGTPGYMSPEQIKNAKMVDHRSDLFSAAVLFYEMLTGHSPFPAPNEFAKLVIILNEEPRPIESLEPSLAQLAPFFRRAFMKDRDQRFQSAREMDDALVAATGGQKHHLAQTDPMRTEDVAAAQERLYGNPSPNAKPLPPRAGTLASSPHAPVSEPAPEISVVPSIAERRGIPRVIVAALVFAALVAGFLLGFAVAQAG